MKDYIFSDKQPEPSFSYDFDLPIFHTREHLLLQKQDGWVSFYILKPAQKRISGCIHFNIENGSAHSPFRSPFGSIAASDTLNPQVLFEFVKYFSERLEKLRCHTINIKNPPRFYGPEAISLLEVFLVNHGYEIVEAEPSAYLIPRAGARLPLRPSEEAKLHQLRNEGCTFERIEASRLGDVFGRLSEWYQKKSYRVSMTAEELARTVQQFADQFHLFGVVSADGVLMAASITVRINNGVLYHFMTNHEASYNSLSPGVMLITGIYQFCVDRGIPCFDLGTSSVAGQPNFSLLDFKLHVGASTSSRFIFRKKL